MELDVPGTRALEPRGRVLLGEPHEAEAGAVALLGMGPLLHDRREERGGGGADGRAPRDQPRRRPLQVRAVRRRHVGRLGRRLVADLAAHVTGDAQPVLKQLDRGRGPAFCILAVGQGRQRAITNRR